MELKEICNVFSGYAFKEFHEEPLGTPVIKIGNIKQDGSIELENCNYTNEIPNIKYKSADGDIYVALSGATTGKIGLMTSNEFYINQRVGIVRLIDKNVPIQYLKFFLISKTKKILKDASGAAQPNISPKQIEKYEFKLKSYEEMNKICNQLLEIENLIKSKKQQILIFEQLIKSQFIEMFGDVDGNEKCTQTLPMTELCEIIDGDRGKNYPKQEEFFEEGYCLFLNAKNVTPNGFSFENCMYITEEKDKILRNGKLSRGDVVLTTRGTIGNLAFYDESVSFEHIRINSGMVILRMKYYIVERFFIEQFKMKLTSIKNKIASGSAQPQLPISTMNKIVMLVPPIELQNQFAAIVEQIDKSKYILQKQINALQELLDSKMEEFFG